MSFSHFLASNTHCGALMGTLHPTKLSFSNSKGMKRCFLCLSIYFGFSNMFSLSHKRKCAHQRIYSREREVRESKTVHYTFAMSSACKQIAEQKSK